LDDYAAVLKKAGLEQRAAAAAAKAQKIKDANPGLKAKIIIHYYQTK
jgi:hypothetical protein